MATLHSAVTVLRGELNEELSIAGCEHCASAPVQAFSSNTGLHPHRDVLPLHQPRC